MVTKLVNQPLGMGNPYAPKKKEWVQVALAAAGLASSLIGGAASSAAARKAARKQREQEAKEQAWYNRRYNEDYLDTAAGQNLVRKAKEFARENWKKAQGASKVGGQTEAASAMAKEAGNKMMGNTMANIAAQDTARKDRVDDIHRQNQERYAQMDIQRENQRAENIKTAAQGASNAMLSMAGAVGGVGSGKTNLTGGSNNSVVTRDAEIAAAKMSGMASRDMEKIRNGQGV